MPTSWEKIIFIMYILISMRDKNWKETKMQITDLPPWRHLKDEAPNSTILYNFHHWEVQFVQKKMWHIKTHALQNCCEN